MVQYKQLFSITCNHNYFPGGVLPGLTLRPTEHTNAMMQHYGMRSRVIENKFEIYYNENNSVKPEDYDTDKETVLSFFINCSDPIFLHYTDLSIADSTKGVVQLTNNTNRQELSQEAENAPRTDQATIALVRITLSGLEDGTGFEINYEARKTFWRYFLIDVNDTCEGFELKMNGINVAINTESPTEQTLPDGQQATVLTLAAPIALQQQPEEQLALSMRRKGQGNAPTTEIRLPSASADRLSPIEGDTENFHSDIYVYL